MTFGDGKFVIDAANAGKILADEYKWVGSDKKDSPQNIGDHDIVNVGKFESRKQPFHSATKEANTDTYKQKNDVTKAYKNQTLDQVTDYQNNGDDTGTRDYYRKINEK